MGEQTRYKADIKFLKVHIKMHRPFINLHKAYIRLHKPNISLHKAYIEMHKPNITLQEAYIKFLELYLNFLEAFIVFYKAIEFTYTQDIHLPTSCMKKFSLLLTCLLVLSALLLSACNNTTSPSTGPCPLRPASSSPPRPISTPSFPRPV